MHGGIAFYGVYVFSFRRLDDLHDGGVVLNGYLACVIGTILVCSLLTAIAPKGKTSDVIVGVCKLACVLAILSPIPFFLAGEELEGNLTKKILSFFEGKGIKSDGEFIKYYSELRVKNTEKALQEELKTLYGVQVRVILEWRAEMETFVGVYEVENIRIDRICVFCEEGVSEEVKRDMNGYLSKNYCSEVLIE